MHLLEEFVDAWTISAVLVWILVGFIGVEDGGVGEGRHF